MPTTKVPAKVPKKAPSASKSAKKASSYPSRQVKRESVVKVRMTADQRRVMEQASRKEGLDLSTWIRMVGLRASGYMQEPK